MSPLDQLEPLIPPAPVAWWPPAPGWWVVAALIPIALWGLWLTRQHWQPRRKPKQSAEAPLDPVRQAALDELARLPRPYDRAPAGPWLQA
ncbi:DUF4381 family protein, partial [Pseudomonas sp. ATCC 13867]